MAERRHSASVDQRQLASWPRRLGREALAVFQRLHRAVLAEGPRADDVDSTAQQRQRYFDPAILARVGFSPVLARVVVEGFLTGLHQSPFHGLSVEFADHREYVPGDDLRYLDWALYARTDHYHIKRFEEETNLRCHILLDRSASMAFGTGSLTKWDYSCFLASCLAYLMIRQQDAVGLGLFGASPGVFVPPRCRRSHLRLLMSAMMQNSPAGSTNIPTSLHAMVRNLKRRGMVLLIGDLIDDPEKTLRAIRLLAGHGHDVIVFHVLDGAELDLDFDRPAMFRDLETGELLEVDPRALRAEYRRHVTDLREFYRQGLAEMQIDYQVLDTRTSYETSLSAYLHRRAKVNR
jgi:uncharacterized protein (DUF58 family)